MTTIQKWGNSLGIRIPHDIATELGLTAGKQVTLEKRDGALAIRPLAIPRYSLKALLKGMKPPVWTKEDREWLDAPPVGREII